jgi:aspartyl-tRNA(Asn)/glutamyl-tRNA(Gln) amidotransferase subunit A
MAQLPPDPLPAGGIAEFAARLRQGAISAEQAAQNYLGRIKALDRKLQAFVHVAEDQALQAARAMDGLLKAGHDLGPLMGVPVAIKDLISVDGMPTRAGSELDLSDILEPEGGFVKALKMAGCIILGKTRTIEFAAGAHNIAKPTPWNPSDLATHKTPGGSSNGSAVAMAAGLCALAVGSDTGGSVRLPAALCSVFGLKTSTGLWPLDGVFPLCPKLDTLGLLTRSADDAALAYGALNECPMPKEADLQGLRLGVPENHVFDDLDPEVALAVASAMKQLDNAGVVFKTIRLEEAAEAKDIFAHLVPADLIATLGRERIERDGRLMDPVAFDRISHALELPADGYARGLQRLKRLAEIGASKMQGLDGWIHPTAPCLPIPVSDCQTLAQAAEFAGRALHSTRLANIYGLCASSMPLSHLAGGQSVGLQISCAHGQDARLLSICLAAQKVIGLPARPEIYLPSGS